MKKFTLYILTAFGLMGLATSCNDFGDVNNDPMNLNPGVVDYKMEFTQVEAQICGSDWDVWRNGNGSNITGHQQVVEMIRDLGAKNIIIAAGLDWGYSLSGIGGESNYDLVDQGTENNSAKTGNGIVYDTHIYPWKGRTANWDATIGNARKKYPVLIGEN